MAKISPIICTGCSKPVTELYHIYPGKFQCMTTDCDEAADTITTDMLIKHVYEQLTK